jgi:hypothetical protein
VIRMGIVTTVLGLVGFGWGFALGLVLGYFIFIYLQPNDVKVLLLLLLFLPPLSLSHQLLYSLSNSRVLGEL